MFKSLICCFLVIMVWTLELCHTAMLIRAQSQLTLELLTMANFL